MESQTLYRLRVIRLRGRATPGGVTVTSVNEKFLKLNEKDGVLFVSSRPNKKRRRREKNEEGLRTPTNGSTGNSLRVGNFRTGPGVVFSVGMSHSSS